MRDLRLCLYLGPMSLDRLWTEKGRGKEKEEDKWLCMTDCLDLGSMSLTDSG